MTINAIVAVGLAGEMGLRGSIPWLSKMPRDMKFFKEKTQEHVIIMGRRTAESLRLPLKTRKAIVVTNKANENMERYGEHSHVVDSLEKAVTLANDIIKDYKGISIIGGAQIYSLALEMDLVDVLYLTTVHANFEADVFFKFDKAKFELTHQEAHAPDEKNEFGCSFETYKRKTK